MSDITRIMAQIDAGDPAAADQLLPLIYDELRRLARLKLLQEKPGQTLQATALVHEAYVRLVGGQEAGVGSQESEKWECRGHFFAAAAEAMRRILVENARRKARVKHGGQVERIELPDVSCDGVHEAEDLLALESALTRLAAEEPEKAELVKLRYFAGLKLDQAAAVLGISRATASRHWTYARAWLYNVLTSDARN
jgi:RNA polymerase sigma factor (TIGR02999 family)